MALKDGLFLVVGNGMSECALLRKDQIADMAAADIMARSNILLYGLMRNGMHLFLKDGDFTGSDWPSICESSGDIRGR